MIDDFNTNGKLPKVSILMNDVNMRSGYGYYGYGKYGYGYGYNGKRTNGYFDDEAVPSGTIWKRAMRWMDMGKWDRTKTKV